MVEKAIWRIQNLTDRKREMQTHLTYSHSHHPKAHQKEVMIDKIVNGLSFDPGMYREDLMDYTLIPANEVDVKKLSGMMDTIDLTTLLHDPALVDEKVTPFTTNFMYRLIRNTKSKSNPLPHTTRYVLDGSRLLSKILNYWKPDTTLHICNHDPMAMLNPSQIRDLQQDSAIKKDDKLPSFISERAKADTGYFTDKITTHMNLSQSKRSILEKACSYSSKYRNKAAGQYRYYCNGLYEFAEELVDKKTLKPEDIPTEIYNKMVEISNSLRKYGIPANDKDMKNGTECFPNLLSYCESSWFRQSKIAPEQLHGIYNFFRSLGYHGLFYIPHLKGEKNDEYIDNPYVAITTSPSEKMCEEIFQKDPLLETHQVTNDTLNRSQKEDNLDFFSNENISARCTFSKRLNEVESYTYSIKYSTTQSVRKALKQYEKWLWIHKTRNPSEFWWHNNTNWDKKAQESFARYQEGFKGRAYRYILNYIGGRLHYLRKYFRRDGGIVATTFSETDPVKKFCQYMEIQYLIAFGIRVKNISRVIDRLMEVFWIPHTFSKKNLSRQELLKEFGQRLKTALNKYHALLNEFRNPQIGDPIRSKIYRLEQYLAKKHYIKAATVLFNIYRMFPEQKMLKTSVWYDLVNVLNQSLFEDLSSDGRTNCLLEDMYNYQITIFQLRHFYRSHHFNMPNDWVDFSFPYHRVNELNSQQRRILFSEIVAQDRDTCESTISNEEKYFATYDIGIQYSRSLLTGVNPDKLKGTKKSEEEKKKNHDDISTLYLYDLVLHQQVLNFLIDPEKYNRRQRKKCDRRKKLNEKLKSQGKSLLPELSIDKIDSNFNGFLKLMCNPNETRKEEYKVIYELYNGKNNLVDLNKSVNERIALFTRKRKKGGTVDVSERQIPDIDAFSTQNFDTLPKFEDPRNPLPHEITPHRFERLAAQSVKNCCAYVGHRVLEMADLFDIPAETGQNAPQKVLKQYKKLTGKNQANYYDTIAAYYWNNARAQYDSQLTLLKATREELDPLKSRSLHGLNQFLFCTRFSGKFITNLIDTFKAKKIEEKEKVKFYDRRNLEGRVRGFRRKLDSFMTDEQLKLEDLSDIFIDMQNWVYKRLEKDFIGDEQKKRDLRYAEEDALINSQRNSECNGLEGTALKEKEKQYRKEDKERETQRKKEQYNKDHSYRTCLGWFQRNYCAHLFLTDFKWKIGDKISRYPVNKYRAEFEIIKGYYEEYRINHGNKMPVEIANKITHFEVDNIIQAAKDYLEFLKEVQNEIDENYFEKVELFTNQDLVERYKVLWGNYLPGTAYTKYVERYCIIKDEYIKALNKEKREYNKERKKEDKKKPEIKSVIDPLFGVMAFAYAKKYNKASAGLIKALTEENCLTKPFKKDRKKQKDMKEKGRVYRKVLPLDLNSVEYYTGFQLVGWKTEIDRNKKNEIIGWLPMNKTEVSKALRTGKPIYLKIPLYMDEEWEGEDLDIKGYGRGKSKICRLYLWFQFKPSKKIRYCLSMGANIQSLRILPPRGAAQKIVIQVIMSASDTDPFIHATNFIESWNKSKEKVHMNFKTQLTKLGTVRTLASDLNKLSRYMTALSTPTKQLDLRERLAEWDIVFRRLESIRKYQIPYIKSKIDKAENDINSLSPEEYKLLKRLQGLYTILHRKRMQIMNHYKKQAMMIILYVMSHLNPECFALDGIKNIQAHKKTGNLPEVIKSLPQSEKITAMFVKWANDLQEHGILNQFEIQISNPHTGQYCPKCLQKLIDLRPRDWIEYRDEAKTKKKMSEYRRFICSKCEYGNPPSYKHRDATAAQIAAILYHNQQI